jgi:hypothetical protein
MSDFDKNYSDLLNELTSSNPLTASLLKQAEQRRKSKLHQYLKGVRFSGFEELMQHLDTVYEMYLTQDQLSKIAFLLKRSKGAFVIALEAALTGFNTVAHEAMRSVMEIEFLLRDFSLDASRIDEWLTADSDKLYERFRPGVLRQRFASHVGQQPKDLPEATDYKGHSMFLHVGPRANPFGTPGLADGSQPFAADSCFWEIFEHARRLLIAAHTLADTIQPGCLDNHNLENLEKLGEAWVRTQEMKQIWQQLIESVAAERLR